MKFVVTGASGFVGRQLVASLQAAGVGLCLVGRDVDKLRVDFPDCRAICYQDIGVLEAGYDAVLYLATINNDQDLPYHVFTQVNVDLAVTTCISARAAGIARFVYFSSTHALNLENTSNYARSKRAAQEALGQILDIDIVTLFLPKVLGDRFEGKLSVLNALPTSSRRFLGAVLGALKPTVHVSKIASALLTLEHRPGEKAATVLVSDGQHANIPFKIIKRALDLAFAAVILLVFSWLMALIWILVRLDSPGPGLFRQARVGREERVFTCYKFRTMYVSTPNLGSHEVATSSITRIGAFLRRTKLDELPQAVNIALNHMSLVGPRPCLPSQKELIDERREKGIFDVKPGITGLAQIHNVDMSDPPHLAAWDARYIQLQSIVSDIAIILGTAMGRGSGDAAGGPPGDAR